MEQQPNNEELEPIRHFRLEFNTGIELHCNQQNCSGFLHKDEPHGDHLFIHQLPPAVEEERGDYVFREQLGNEMFNHLIARMRLGGFAIINSEDGKMNDDDREAYEEFKALQARGALANQAQQETAKLPPLDWISPRQEKVIKDAVAFLIHLAERGKL